jgi:hypothetical protein
LWTPLFSLYACFWLSAWCLVLNLPIILVISFRIGQICCLRSTDKPEVYPFFHL